MGYYDVKENVEQYIKMSDSYSGNELISILINYLPDHSTLLELGMGEGKDLLTLSNNYQVTGSDSSQSFLDLFAEKHPEIETIRVDAEKICIDQKFDAIYSNKVLYHLTRKDLKKSISQQAAILNPGGIVAHSFWEGDKEENYLDLHFVFYTLKNIRDLFSREFEILYLDHYKEDKKDDSIFIIARKSEYPI